MSRFAAGAPVRTTSDGGSRDWTEAARASRRWGADGFVVAYHPTSGVYEVEHLDTMVAYYESDELVPGDWDNQDERVSRLTQQLRDGVRARKALVDITRLGHTSLSCSGRGCACGHDEAERALAPYAWEDAAVDTRRLAVPGGWLYAVGGNVVFVPQPARSG